MRYFILFLSLLAITLVSCAVKDNTPTPIVVKPTIPLAVQQQTNAVDSFYYDANGKPLTTHADVQARINQNGTLKAQYQLSIQAIDSANKKLSVLGEQITEATWAFWVYLAAGIVGAAGIVFGVILVIESPATILSFGLLEKLDAGILALAAVLLTIAHYLHYLMYLPVIIAIGTGLTILFVIVTHSGAKFLSTIKNIISTGAITDLHLANPIVAAIAAKAKAEIAKA
jgi:hypothetical protein